LIKFKVFNIINGANKIKNKKCPTVVTIPKSNPKIIETEEKFISLTHIYRITPFLVWYKQLSKKWQG
jgi:hypothetical protein